LEKKNLEFDVFKKERTATQAAPKAAAAALEMSDNIDMPLSQQTVEEGAIKIVRNVRGTFKTADAPANSYPHSWETEQQGEGIGSSTAETGTGTIEDTKRWPPADRQKTTMDNTLRPKLAAAVSPATSEADVVIPFFSQAAQGADFNFLNSAIVNVLKTRPDRTIFVSCAGVDLLSDPDLDYLEKICASIASQNRSLAFVQCGRNLAPLMMRRPSLASLVK
jgi:hypothetical protein